MIPLKNTNWNFDLFFSGPINLYIIINIGICKKNKKSLNSIILSTTAFPTSFKNVIDPIKDIDGLTKINVGKLFTDKAELISCTPKGIMTLLKNYNVEFEGKHVVIVGRSNLVGKPLISLCLNENATVTICHSKTKNLEKFTREADILIVAVGKKEFITKDMVKENAVVVDVGINRDNDSKKIFGDVKFDEVEPIASLITPVPGGVGPMTTITLMENVLVSYNLMNNES